MEKAVRAVRNKVFGLNEASKHFRQDKAKLQKIMK
jgi:hypothetical protein